MQENYFLQLLDIFLKEDYNCIRVFKVSLAISSVLNVLMKNGIMFIGHVDKQLHLIC